jgi:hypothetical protein
MLEVAPVHRGGFVESLRRQDRHGRRAGSLARASRFDVLRISSVDALLRIAGAARKLSTVEGLSISGVASIAPPQECTAAKALF